MERRWIAVLAACALSLTACTYHGGGCDDDWDHRFDEDRDRDADEGFDEDWDGDFDERIDEARGRLDGSLASPDAGVSADLACGGRCVAGEVCVEGACLELDEACRADIPCGAGRVCVDNACRPACEADSECVHGTRCLDGLCRPSAECSGASDCEASEACVESRCLATCTTHASCGDDAVCRDGVCRPDVAPRPFCRDDAECASGHRCIHGVCRTPCPTGTDEECQRWDTQLVLCAEPEPGLNLCYTRAESNPECVLREECEAGRHCIDGLCR